MPSIEQAAQRSRGRQVKTAFVGVKLGERWGWTGLRKARTVARSSSR